MFRCASEPDYGLKVLLLPLHLKLPWLLATPTDY